MLIFLYFDIYIFLVFLNYLKVCVTRRERSDRHEKERKTIFGIFENECHAVRTTRLTQKEKEIIFSIFELFERKCHTTRAVGQTLKWNKIIFCIFEFSCFFLWIFMIFKPFFDFFIEILKMWEKKRGKSWRHKYGSA